MRHPSIYIIKVYFPNLLLHILIVNFLRPNRALPHFFSSCINTQFSNSSCGSFVRWRPQARKALPKLSENQSLILLLQRYVPHPRPMGHAHFRHMLKQSKKLAGKQCDCKWNIHGVHFWHQTWPSRKRRRSWTAGDKGGRVAKMLVGQVSRRE